MNIVHPRINDAYRQMKQHLDGGILPLWMESGLGREHEESLACFDAEGRATDNADKFSRHTDAHDLGNARLIRRRCDG
jgi:mannose/cellobiose epimerase-like protein (N-acyl-D-glucosamine 2-epimerase family)